MKQTLKNATLLCAVLVFALAFGCAKKPVSEAPTTTAAPAPTADRSQDGTFSSQSVTDEASQIPASLQRVHFEFDSYVLNSSAKAALEDNATYLKAYPSKRVQIEGHCDERGSDEYNLVLGEKRARATKAYLVTLGVDGRRLSVISFGEERPLDPASGESAWAKNRRAEFVTR